MSTSKDWLPTSSLRNFGVVPRDPGYIYVLQQGEKFKIGRSQNPIKRMKEAKTWLPDATVLGIKPFWSHKSVEKNLHIGFSRAWYEQEWFVMPDEGYEYILKEGFSAFSNSDINKNSIDFIYWFNGEGMAEFVREFCAQNISKKQFLSDETDIHSKKS